MLTSRLLSGSLTSSVPVHDFSQLIISCKEKQLPISTQLIPEEVLLELLI